MANRVTTLRTQVFLAGGSLYVTALRLSTFTSISDTKARPTTLRLGAFTNDKTNGPRATTLRLGVYTNDKTSPVRATTQRIQTWVSLDSAFYALPPFGSHEVFTPDFFIDPQYEFPTPPTIEVNPYRAVEPNTDLQQILREQHNTTQAGDSTFHWGVLTQIYNEPLYNLGSLGKFYHDDLGIIHARYCRFVDFNPTDSKATPVGLRKPSNLPWTVTNQLTLSDPDAVVGIAIPYDTKVNIGTWYGWVITDGFVPTEVALVTSSLKYPFGTEYAWAANGAVRQELDSNSVGYRVQIGGPPWLVPGAFYVNTDRSSLGRMNGLITTRITPLVNDIDGLNTRLVAVEELVAGHTIEIGAINKRHDDFKIFMTKEVKSLADALLAIRSLMPDTNFKVYVDTALIALKGYTDTQLSLVGGVANAGLARANEAYALAQSISYDGMQSQLDAINNAMGGITNRLIGFNVTIDTNVLTAGQTLVSYLVSTDAFGVNYYDFRPLDYKTSALLDVDWSIPPTDGQVLLWDAASSKFIPGLAAGGLPDAPSDGTIYGRKDGAWEAVTGGGGGGGTSWMQGGGERRLVIIATASGGSTGDPQITLGAGPVNGFYWATDAVTKNLKFKFPSPLIVDGFCAIQTSTTAMGTWTIAGSNDDVTYTDIINNFVWGGTAYNPLGVTMANTYAREFTNTTQYQYYRLRLNPTFSTSNSPFQIQFLFKCEAIA